MQYFDFSFWQNFGSNFLATIIGVALGIPIAFWINRRVETTNESERKEKILQVLSVELNENLRVVSEWQRAGKEDQEMTTIGARMSDEVWNTLSDGGELQWIKDPVLLSGLAFTYAEIKRIKYLSDKYLSLIGSNSQKKFLRDLSNELWFAIDEVWDVIVLTSGRIDKHLGLTRMTEEELVNLIMRLKEKRAAEKSDKRS